MTLINLRSICVLFTKRLCKNVLTKHDWNEIHTAEKYQIQRNGWRSLVSFTSSLTLHIRTLSTWYARLCLNWKKKQSISDVDIFAPWFMVCASLCHEKKIPLSRLIISYENTTQWFSYVRCLHTMLCMVDAVVCVLFLHVFSCVGFIKVNIWICSQCSYHIYMNLT